MRRIYWQHCETCSFSDEQRASHDDVSTLDSPHGDPTWELVATVREEDGILRFFWKRPLHEEVS